MRKLLLNVSQDFLNIRVNGDHGVVLQEILQDAVRALQRAAGDQRKSKIITAQIISDSLTGA